MRISIPKPCHEDWESMTPTDKGRHCAACAKTVIDFTGMGDLAVRRTLRGAGPGQTCGRFYPDQLNRPLSAGVRASPVGWLALVAAGLTGIGTATDNPVDSPPLAQHQGGEQNGKVDAVKSTCSIPPPGARVGEATLIVSEVEWGVEPPMTGGIELAQQDSTPAYAEAVEPDMGELAVSGVRNSRVYPVEEPFAPPGMVHVDGAGEDPPPPPPPVVSTVSTSPPAGLPYGTLTHESARKAQTIRKAESPSVLADEESLPRVSELHRLGPRSQKSISIVPKDLESPTEMALVSRDRSADTIGELPRPFSREISPLTLTPNPSGSTTRILVPKGGTLVNVYSTGGDLRFSKVIDGDVSELELPVGSAAGVYLVEVVDSYGMRLGIGKWLVQ